MRRIFRNQPTVSGTQSEDLTLFPASIRLLSVKGYYASQYDVTFGADCKHVYYVDTLEPGVNSIHVITTDSDVTSSLSISNEVFPSALVMELGDSPKPYYPKLTFLYAIDADHLLLSFSNPTTGSDAATNQSSQALLELTHRTVTFISEGGGMSPVLLDYRNNLLIMPEQLSTTPVANRTQINLSTGDVTSIKLRNPYQFTEMQCDTAANTSDCRYSWLKALLD